jgi:hypothetical protein
MVSHLQGSITPTPEYLRVRTWRSKCSVRRKALPQCTQIRAFARPDWTGGGMARSHLEKRRKWRTAEVRSRPQAVTPTAHSYLLYYSHCPTQLQALGYRTSYYLLCTVLFFSFFPLTRENVPSQVTLPRCRRRDRCRWNRYAIPCTTNLIHSSTHIMLLKYRNRCCSRQGFCRCRM